LASGLTLADLFALTPQQAFVSLFAAAPAGRCEDKLFVLIRENEARGRRGLPPLCPPWLKQILTERTRVAKPVRPARR